MSLSRDPQVVASLVSPGRFSSYQEAAGGDPAKAVDLYQWSASLSAACFEVFHYVEVVVRNALDREMKQYYREEARLIPWFLLPFASKSQSIFDAKVSAARSRLRSQGPARETRDQIVAGLEFGFWTDLLHGDQEELWRRALYRSFPNSSGKRKDVLDVLERLRLFRNRLAHHDSLLAQDVPLRLQQMLDVVGWVSADARDWLDRVQRVGAVYASRPVARRDTVVVPARDAWPLYQLVNAYVCQPGRSFQPVDHLAFYTDHEIKTEVGLIKRHLDNVDWAPAHANVLLSSASQADRDLGHIIQVSRTQGWTGGRYQVFELTRPGEPGHLTLPNPVPHRGAGKGSAFTQRQRYILCYSLRSASSTDDLR